MIDRIPPEITATILAHPGITPEDLLSLACVSRLFNTFALREFFVGRAALYGDVDTPQWMSYPDRAPWVKVNPEGMALVFRALTIALDVTWCEGIEAICSDVREIRMVTKLITRLAIKGIALNVIVISNDVLDKIGALVVAASRYPLRRLSINFPAKEFWGSDLDVISEEELAGVMSRTVTPRLNRFHTQPAYGPSMESNRFKMGYEQGGFFKRLHPLTTLTEATFDSPIMLMPFTARWLIDSLNASSIDTFELGDKIATDASCCWNHVLQYLALPRLKVLMLNLKVDKHGLFYDFISRHPGVVDLSFRDHDLSDLRLSPDAIPRLSILRGSPRALQGFISTHSLTQVTLVEIYVTSESFRECLAQLAAPTFNHGIKLKLSFKTVHQAVSLLPPSKLKPRKHVQIVTALEIIANREVVSPFDIARLPVYATLLPPWLAFFPNAQTLDLDLCSKETAEISLLQHLITGIQHKASQVQALSLYSGGPRRTPLEWMDWYGKRR
ncbi:hypothetical protein CONPUDRAFT_68695 [Coniophora puteana RWD-64-598 SS2]|uniref:F-box domain-containing protein n=1 Tax=Coniophora puteana (strain RWD-64-598) TaxID=741705 RepID=A0A5M3N5F2_CONPW|nr:uncharacterized protein CONPUDRAFT_68695 [Coniophora puteana RWD-64-598 SS2]EIW86085.1 hypothetical protein CONPUDRAFT_68695 [Coniophora puteana RWD-64-598 SS2]